MLLCAVCAPENLLAQGKATLRGKVTDAKTKEELTGATVKLKGSYYGASANISGDYKIENINAGNYTIEVSLVGYVSVVKTGIQLNAGETRTVDFQLKESTVSAAEVEIIGERPLIDIEKASTQQVISKDVLSSTTARDIKELVATQPGVTQTPFGVYIRGGRSYETGYYIDGVSAQDPLAGTGFGVDVNAKALQEVEITTGGSGVEFGEAPAGVIALKTKEGSNEYAFSVSHQRDNFGFANFDSPVRPNNLGLGGLGWNTTRYDLATSGPIFKNKLFYFVSVNTAFSDEFMRNPAPQLRSTMASAFWMPFNDNRWSSTAKLTWNASERDKFSFLFVNSLIANQNTQMLQIAGNDIQLQPGYQYPFLLNPQNANTYTALSNMQSIQWARVFSKQALLKVSATRLFTSVRAEVGDRPWRPEFITEELAPRSIITRPTYFNPNDSVVYTNAPDGFVNTGIAPLWHDHYAEIYTLNTQLSYKTLDNVHSYLFGVENRFSTYQWIDIVAPWVGAPLTPGDPSRRLGAGFDIWKVSPADGAIFFNDKITYKGVIATVGARLQYWFPGAFVDNAVSDSLSPVPQGFRDLYRSETGELFGRRFQLRLLPKINVSFPVTANQVLYLNYGHSSRLPNARFVYAGLDTRYVDNSFNSRLGNPALRPETTVSYEVGLKSQLTANDVLTVTAFYNDKFDFIVSRNINFDYLGTRTSRATFINQDYARTRGLEVSYQKRIGKWFNGLVSAAYQIATGKSNSADETFAQVQRTGDARDDREFFLAWDRPYDIKSTLVFKHDEERGLFGVGALNQIKLLLTTQFTSGLRYTPQQLRLDQNGQVVRLLSGRELYDPILNRPFDEIGSSIFRIDLSLEKTFRFAGVDSRLTLQVRNLLNNKNAAIINPVTGRGYEFGDPLPATTRDPRFPDIQDSGTPPFNPARYEEPRQILFGFGFEF
jgi:outer membrane receptor protein involved in Fe transport